MMTTENKSANNIETALGPADESTAVGSVGESTNDGSPPQPGQQVSSCADDDAMFLGRWILVDSEMSTSFVHCTSGEMIITRQVNEETGEVEYVSVTSWKIRFCCCCVTCPFTGSNTSVTRLTSKDTFTVTNQTTNLVDGIVEYGRREGGNKFVTVGKKGTNEIEYRGDRCHMKITDARYSLYITQEWERLT